MSTIQKPLWNPKPRDVAQLEHEIRWIENKMLEVREEMRKRPSKIKHLNDLQRQLDHRNDALNYYNQLGI